MKLIVTFHYFTNFYLIMILIIIFILDNALIYHARCARCSNISFCSSSTDFCAHSIQVISSYKVPTFHHTQLLNEYPVGFQPQCSLLSIVSVCKMTPGWNAKSRYSQEMTNIHS